MPHPHPHPDPDQPQRCSLLPLQELQALTLAELLYEVDARQHTPFSYCFTWVAPDPGGNLRYCATSLVPSPCPSVPVYELWRPLCASEMEQAGATSLSLGVFPCLRDAILHTFT